MQIFIFFFCWLCYERRSRSLEGSGFDPWRCFVVVCSTVGKYYPGFFFFFGIFREFFGSGFSRIPSREHD